MKSCLLLNYENSSSELQLLPVAEMEIDEILKCWYVPLGGNTLLEHCSVAHFSQSDRWAAASSLLKNLQHADASSKQVIICSFNSVISFNTCICVLNKMYFNFVLVLVLNHTTVLHPYAMNFCYFILQKGF